MTKYNKLFIQMTTRVYKDKNPRLYHLLQQMECSHSDLITMLGEQAIQMGGLEDVHPRDILNGICYSERINSVDKDQVHKSTTSRLKRNQNSASNNNDVDSELSDGIMNLGIMK